MSFLAQLRQKQPPSSQTLRLCYLLELDARSQLVLGLKLANLKQGELLELDKAYTVQRQHLQHPPPFLGSQDVAILESLVAANKRWLNYPSLAVGERDYHEVLTSILQSERCFIKDHRALWQKLSLGNAVKVQLDWKKSPCGNYQLSWTSAGAQRLLGVGTSLELPLAYEQKTARLSLAQHHFSDEAVDEINKLTSSFLSVTDAHKLVEQKKRLWCSLQLPLPELCDAQEISATLEPVLRFSSKPNQSQDRIALRFRYHTENYTTLADLRVSSNQSNASHDYWFGEMLLRISCDYAQEKTYRDWLSHYLTRLGFEFNNDENYWSSEDKQPWLKLLTEPQQELNQKGFQRYFIQGFRRHYVLADQWQLRVDDVDQILEVKLSIDIGGKSVSLLELLSELKDFNQAHQVLTLTDGRLLLLPREKIKRMTDELGDLLVPNRPSLSLGKNQFNRLHDLQSHLPANSVCLGAVEYLDLAKSLYQTPALLEQMQSGVNAKLRPYQWLGVCWLQHLKHHQVNGLLADDMGLGKTLQTLVHLSLEKQQNALRQPAVIVAPTSLLHNWQAEARKFTPHLRSRIVHGSKRQAFWDAIDEHLSNYDLLITSYQIIINDLEKWQNQNWSWLILDEAQVVKNSRTKAHQALKKIACDNRICLSGTPVENHLGELWSLFDFLNPGLLDSQRVFKHFYQKPIEQQASDEKMSALQRRIAPFLLRRTKQQVAQDLPEKTEITQKIGMMPQQQALYEQQKQASQTQLEADLNQTENAGQRQFLVLNALMKLRQVCCDPTLIGEKNCHSAKREHCIEMLESLVAENRSTLVFSQFTSMLDLIADELAKRGIGYLKLTGKTKQRQMLVDEFQAGKSKVFLISLKAGGVGLNLTQADTVIHYDPWWNSAAENQASDRAHRIGQDNPVFIYKLICENSIEEKILELQQQKANLTQHINQQAELSGEKFALNLEQLMNLWQQETKRP